jgi:hypothetical protein
MKDGAGDLPLSDLRTDHNALPWLDAHTDSDNQIGEPRTTSGPSQAASPANH